jgi:hypothetical protein
LNLGLIILVGPVIDIRVFDKNIIQIIDDLIRLQLCIPETLILSFQKVSFILIAHFIFDYLAWDLFIFFLIYVVSNCVADIVFVNAFLEFI